MNLPKRIVVVGAGLLGGSFLSALQMHRPFGDEDGLELCCVSGAKTLEGLSARGWCDALHPYEDLEKAVEGADLVLLCSPIEVIVEHLHRLARVKDVLEPGAVVTDVGSTKSLLCDHGFRLFAQNSMTDPVFIGGHPMAGSERSGLDAADPLLYQSAIWVLCPPQDVDPACLEITKGVVQTVGARPVVLDPRVHDAAVARISHVPQMVASSLAAWVGADAALVDPSLSLAAGGFRDMTRLAGSSWDMWRDILMTNSGHVADGLDELSARLQHLAQGVRGLSGGAPDGQCLSQSVRVVETEFVDGRALRARFKAPRKGILHDLVEIVVRLEDRPGQLVQVLAPLAQAGINVLDVEILKVREGESGTLLLAFADSGECTRAQEVLTGANFLVMSR